MSFETVEEVINLLEIAFKNKFDEEMYQYILTVFFPNRNQDTAGKKRMFRRVTLIFKLN